MKPRLTALLGALTLLSPLAWGEDSNLVSIDFVVNNQIRRITIQLAPDAAPQTVANFKDKISKGFYNGLAIHRAIPDYLVQMGDPLTKNSARRTDWGTGDPGHTVPAEIKLPNPRGSVAMARLPDGRNPTRASNGSQFYIALGDLTHLNGQYTVFGRVIRGIEHLDHMADQTVDTNDVPMQRIAISGAALGTGATSNNMATLAQNAQNVVTKPVEGLRNATSRMTNAMKDGDGINLPRPKLPKLPSLGRKEKSLDDLAAAAEAEAGAMQETLEEAAPTPEAAPAPLPPALPETVAMATDPGPPYGATSIPDPEDKTRRFALKRPKLPNLSMPSLPKLPRIGRGRDGGNPEATANDAAPPAAPPVNEYASSIPSLPSAVTDQIASAAESVPGLPQATIESVAPVSGDADAKPQKQRVVIPVKKPDAGKEKGAITRVIERVW